MSDASGTDGRARRDRAAGFGLVALTALAAVVAYGLLRLSLDTLPSEDNLRYVALATVDDPTTDGFASLGIAAHPDDDPATVGRRRYEAMRRYLAEHDRQREAPEFHDYPADRRIDPPRARCSLVDETCLRAILPDGASPSELADEHRVLLHRHRAWLSAKDVRPPIRHVGEGWDVEGIVLLGAHRLALLLAADVAERGDAHAAAVELEWLLERSRVRLAEADSLLEKMITARMVSFTIDVIVSTARRGEAPVPAPMAPLGVRERSMGRAFAREFEFVRDAAAAVLSRQPHDRPAPTVLFHAMRLLFDVGATANRVAAGLRSQERLAELPREAFRRARERRRSSPARRAWPSPTDLIGSFVLVPGGLADYGSYIGHLHALDEKIALANHVIGRKGASEAALAESLERVDGLPGGARLADAGRRVCARDPIVPSSPESGCIPVR